MDFQDFASDLTEKLAATDRLAIVGVGADLREDDAVGNLLSKDLISRFMAELKRAGMEPDEFSDKELIKYKGLLVINASVVPENYILSIQEFNPGHVLFIDAANLGNHGSPGDIAFVHLNDLGKRTFSTHTMSLDQVIGIMKSLGIASEFTTIGIQLKNKDYGEELSASVNETKDFLLDLLSTHVKNKYLEVK